MATLSLGICQCEECGKGMTEDDKWMDIPAEINKMIEDGRMFRLTVICYTCQVNIHKRERIIQEVVDRRRRENGETR
jgi:hypothetical protein